MVDLSFMDRLGEADCSGDNVQRKSAEKNNNNIQDGPNSVPATVQSAASLGLVEAVAKFASTCSTAHARQQKKKIEELEHEVISLRSEVTQMKDTMTELWLQFAQFRVCTSMQQNLHSDATEKEKWSNALLKVGRNA